MPTAKAERLLDLVIALLNAPRFRTASWIRVNVAGYGDAVSDEAFSRMFERDKQELRDLGIPIQTVGGNGDGYRILPGELELPPMSFTPAEAAALAMAGRLWDTTLLADAGSAALRKIRDAADPGELGAGVTPADALDAATPTVSVLQARVRTSEPSFAPLYAAVRAKRVVRFEYRKSPGTAVESRSLEPWGLVSYHGAWYVVGRDSDRQAQRTFRLSRIVGAVEAVGAAGAVRVPEGIDLQASLGGADDEPGDRSALLRIRPGAAAGLRRGGEVLSAASSTGVSAASGTGVSAASGTGVSAASGTGGSDGAVGRGGFDSRGGFDEVRIPLESFWDVARRIAATGPDIVVVDPPDLRDAVIGLLAGAARSSGRTVAR